MKTFLFNPFAKYSEKILLVFGCIATIFGGFTAYFFNAVYDGAIDLHLVPGVSIGETAKYLIVDILTIVICLSLAGKIINKKTRLVDILSTTLIARIPLYALPLFNAGNHLFNRTSAMTEKLLKGETDIVGADMIFTLLFAMVTIAFAVWFFALLWNGFKVATNARGTKPVVLFIVAILVAEIISKIILSNL